MKRIAIGKHVVEWVAKQTNEFGNFGAAQGIGLQEYSVKDKCWKLVAGVAYAEWNGVNVVCHIASDKTRRWANREFLWTIFDYPFRQLNVKRITVCIGQGNIESIKFVEHLGFQFETLLGEDSHPTGRTLIYYAREPHVKRWLDLRIPREERMAA